VNGVLAGVRLPLLHPFWYKGAEETSYLTSCLAAVDVLGLADK